MSITTYVIGEDGRLERRFADVISAAWITDETNRWIDLGLFNPEQLEELLTPLDLPSSLREACLCTPTRPVTIATTDALFVSIPVHLRDKTPVYLSFLVLPTTLITVRHGDIPGLTDIGANWSQSKQPIARHSAGLLHRLLLRVLSDLTNNYYELRARVFAMAAEIEEDSSAIEAAQILTLKRTASMLVQVLEDQTIVIAELRETQSEKLELDAIRTQLADLLQDIQLGITMLTRLEDRIRDLYQFHLQVLGKATNKRLSILTVLSAVYLPSTLIAGIYGMNFEYIPILGTRYGYAFALALMVGLVVGQVWFFYRRGWFR